MCQKKDGRTGRGHVRKAYLVSDFEIICKVFIREMLEPRLEFLARGYLGVAIAANEDSTVAFAECSPSQLIVFINLHGVGGEIRPGRARRAEISLTPAMAIEVASFFVGCDPGVSRNRTTAPRRYAKPPATGRTRVWRSASQKS